MSKYEAVYFVGDNQAINRVRVDSYKTRNRGAFSGSLAALIISAISIDSFTSVNIFYNFICHHLAIELYCFDTLHTFSLS